LALLDQPGQAIGPGRVKVTPPPGKPIRSAGGLDASEVAAAGMTGSSPTHAAPAPAPFKIATATPKLVVAKPAAGPKSIDAALASASQVSGSPVVQIGAFSSAALSDQGYEDVSKIMVGHMVGKAKHVMTVDHAGATLFCATLKAHSKPCFVKG
jgi:cell division septation protein DedD